MINIQVILHFIHMNIIPHFITNSHVHKIFLFILFENEKSFIVFHSNYKGFLNFLLI